MKYLSDLNSKKLGAISLKNNELDELDLTHHYQGFTGFRGCDQLVGSERGVECDRHDDDCFSKKVSRPVKGR